MRNNDDRTHWQTININTPIPVSAIECDCRTARRYLPGTETPPRNGINPDKQLASVGFDSQ